jgi:serine/threonine protein kinase
MRYMRPVDPSTAHAIPPQLGEFRPVAVLGRGGSGVVYDAAWGPRRVALKVLHPHLVGTPSARAQFLAEAKRLQSIAHPSVVKVLAAGELADGRPYLAMERLEGEPLAAVLARGPLALPRALALFGELCAAVGALHEQQLVHRDLKPENVLIVHGGEGVGHAVLLDFGIAKELASPASTTTVDGGVRGTPAYMAPERFFGQPAGVATDIYELAVTFYAMLAGRLPWDDFGDPEARLSPRPLVELASVPTELDVEVRRALSTRAQNRPTSAAALLATIRAAAGVAAESTTADPPVVAGTAETAQLPPARPWFAERHSTTDRRKGETPLAWAPTEAPVPAGPTTPARRSRRMVVVASVGAGAMIGAAIVVWRLVAGSPPNDQDLAAPPVVALAPPAPIDAPGAPDAADPWDQPARDVTAERVIEPFELAGPVPAPAAARAEVAANLIHVPPDTKFVMSVVLGELHAHEQFDDFLGRLAKQPLMIALANAFPPCVAPTVRASDWVILAAQGLAKSKSGTIVAHGRWDRAAVERCFAVDGDQTKGPDGVPMLQLHRGGWVDFVDDQTIVISLRDDLKAEAVHGFVRHGGTGPVPLVRRMIAAMPAARSVMFAIDGSSGSVEELAEYIPPGSDVAAWLRVDRDSELSWRVDAKQDAIAALLEQRLRPRFDEIFRNKGSNILGSFNLERTGSVFQIRGTLSPLVVGMLGATLP